LSHLDFDIVSDLELRIKNHPSSACPLPAVHFVPLLLCPFASTVVENIRQINLFMQNKPNFPHFSPENEDFTKKQTQFKPNSNPIKANFGPKIRVAKPIQSQTNPILGQLQGWQTQTNPIYRPSYIVPCPSSIISRPSFIARHLYSVFCILFFLVYSFLLCIICPKLRKELNLNGDFTKWSNQ